MKKSTFILAIALFSLSSVIHAQDEFDEFDEKIKYAENYSIALIPTTLANNAVGIEGTYKYRKNKSVALQLIFIESQITLGFEDDFFDEPNIRLYNGIALNLNHRYYFGDFGFDYGRSFLDAGIHFSSVTFNAREFEAIPDPNNPNVLIPGEVRNEYVTSRVGFNLIIGRELRFNENLFVDVFGGFLYRVAANEEPDFNSFLNNDRYPNSRWGFNYIGANFTIGAKFGIFFD